MSSDAAPPFPSPCPHERRPGTVVCLKCRNAERAASLRKVRRVVGWAMLTVGGVAAVVAGVRAGTPIARAWLDKFDAHQAARATAPTPPPVPATLVSRVESRTTSGHAGGDTADPPRPARPPLTPTIPEGRTTLHDGVVADRVGRTVVVHFDTPELRTRRPEKYVRILRSTLPAVYGARAESLLTAPPIAQLAQASSLVEGDTPAPLVLALDDGWSLELRPETRPGRDGPLIVTYRATVMR